VKRNSLTRAFLAAAVFVMSTGGIAAEERLEALKNPYDGRTDVLEEGGSLLNQYCSHCHGPYAEQGERVRDLRRLNIRYGDDAINLYWTTVNNGRMDKGMPVWKEAISDDIKWRIYTFLQSVQTKK
jgi:mono/diheme cytochrome c family protein